MPYLLITHRVKQVPEVNVLNERLKFTSQMEPILASRVDQWNISVLPLHRSQHIRALLWHR